MAARCAALVGACLSVFEDNGCFSFKVATAALPFSVEYLHLVIVANGEAEIVKLDVTGQRRVHSAQVERERATDEDEDVVVATKVEDFPALVLEDDGNLRRKKKVVGLATREHVVVASDAVDREEAAAVVRVQLPAFVPSKLERPRNGRGFGAVPLQEVAGTCVTFADAAFAGQFGLAVVVELVLHTIVLPAAAKPVEVRMPAFHLAMQRCACTGCKNVYIKEREKMLSELDFEERNKKLVFT